MEPGRLVVVMVIGVALPEMAAVAYLVIWISPM
jgi:hypothetical protein